jgi:hypothetical protein
MILAIEEQHNKLFSGKTTTTTMAEKQQQQQQQKEKEEDIFQKVINSISKQSPAPVAVGANLNSPLCLYITKNYLAKSPLKPAALAIAKDPSRAYELLDMQLDSLTTSKWIKYTFEKRVLENDPFAVMISDGKPDWSL